MTLWSSSSLGTISKYAFYSSLFLDKRMWSRQWTPSQIWVQCVLWLSIKQTGYRDASGGAWTVVLYELLLTFPHYCWRSNPVLSWNGMLSRWRESREGSVRGWEHMAYKIRLRELYLLSLMERRQKNEPMSACDSCQEPSEQVRAKCFHPDGKI